MKIGGIMPRDRSIVLNSGRATLCLTVSNVGDRPIQVGSHFHFFETNRLLEFDRAAAYGFRLDIPSGTSVRFEPGEQKQVQLVAIGGRCRVFGLNDLCCGHLSRQNRVAALQNANTKGFMKEKLA